MGLVNKKNLTATVALSAMMMLTACSGMAERVANIGKVPKLTAIETPYKDESYKPVSLPMPNQEAQNMNESSLWQAGRQTFFKDQRAHQVGDIMTVFITISDEATLENKTERTREGEEGQSLPNFLGLESKLGKFLPDCWPCLLHWCLLFCCLFTSRSFLRCLFLWSLLSRFSSRHVIFNLS